MFCTLLHLQFKSSDYCSLMCKINVQLNKQQLTYYGIYDKWIAACNFDATIGVASSHNLPDLDSLSSMMGLQVPERYVKRLFAGSTSLRLSLSHLYLFGVSNRISSRISSCFVADQMFMAPAALPRLSGFANGTDIRQVLEGVIDSLEFALFPNQRKEFPSVDKFQHHIKIRIVLNMKKINQSSLKTTVQCRWIFPIDEGKQIILKLQHEWLCK